MKNFRASDMPGKGKSEKKTDKKTETKKASTKKVDSVEPGIADKAKAAAKENPAKKTEQTEIKTAPAKDDDKKD